MKSNNQFALLGQRRFMPFFITQFLGAFNDNVFKNALIIMIAYQGAQFSDINANTLTNLSAGLFILPFFLVSATAGQWIDRTEKSHAIRLIKLLEIVIMALAAVAFVYGNLYMMIGLLFLMGTQSTFFGPAKYSYIPQHLKANELVGGNALVQSGTFVAILAGTILGGNLIAGDQGRIYVGITLVVIAVIGYLSSLGIPHTPSVDSGLKINWNIFSETGRNIRFIKKNRTVFLSVLGISWFWFLGATYLVQLPGYTREFLAGDEQVVTMLLAFFMIGIGIGSMLCNVLSGQKLEIGLVPFGSIGLTIFGIDLFFAKPEIIAATLMNATEFLKQPYSFRILADISLIGIFGGFYIVPLFALVQQRSDPSHLSRVIAGNNVLNALFMVLSSVMAIVLINADVNTATILLVTAILNAFVAIYIYTLVPEFLMRFMVWILIHTIYHVRKQG
ncbi:MAG TPA: MFS transporter, partial [Gammaproteobacteria bacterium]|nr:MFS transporter [Gammaproteobacteria bacterium]